MRSVWALTRRMMPPRSTMTMASGADSRRARKRWSSGGMLLAGRSGGIGETQAEYGARGPVFHPDAAAVRLDGETTEGEAEAAARAGDAGSALDLYERVEDALAHRFRDAAAEVGDAELGGA